MAAAARSYRTNTTRATGSSNRLTPWAAPRAGNRERRNEDHVSRPAARPSRVRIRAPISRTHAYGTSLASTTGDEYDANDDLVAVKDPDGQTTRYGYDEANDRTSMTEAEGQETTWTYDAKHDVVSERLPSGSRRRSNATAPAMRSPVSRPAPESQTQTTGYEYNGDGELVAMTDPVPRPEVALWL